MSESILDKTEPNSPITTPATAPNLTTPVPAAAQARRSNRAAAPSGLMAAAIIIVSLLSGFGGGYLAGHQSTTSVGGVTLSNQKKIVTSQSQLISQIAKTVSPSVVSVNVSINSTTSSADTSSPLSQYFGYSQPQAEQAAGTGIILNGSGIILTNRHVVPEGTTTVSVTLSDGTELKDVSVVGRTNASDSLDVAFLKINNLEGHKLTPATLGDSGKVQVGDDVVAIGNALGQFQNTVTAGIVSGYGRTVQASSDSGSNSYSAASDTENLDNLFQTDAAINEGNSGGPLVNLNGQVIGLNTAIAGDAQNIGFAIPVNDISGLVNQVLKTGKFERTYLGVHYVPLTAEIAKQYKLSVNAGAYIAPANGDEASVVAGSPADKAGLKEGDIITKVEGTKIDTNHSLTSLLSQHQPNDKVTLTIVRDGKSKTIDVTLGQAPTS